MNITRDTTAQSAIGEFSTAGATDESPTRYPFWLLPNLLSLDAPIVAVVWHALLARSLHRAVEAVTLTLLATSVWTIYAADRLLDVRSALPSTPRHHFARAHRNAFILPMAAAILLGIALSVFALPVDTLLGGLAAVAGVVVYLVWIHHPRFRVVHSGIKRIAVSVLFATGVILPLHGVYGLALAWTATAAVVWLNTLAIDWWESTGTASISVAFAAPVTGSICLLFAGASAYYAALSLGAFLLFGLNGLCQDLSRNALRVYADLALLAPAFAMLLR